MMEHATAKKNSSLRFFITLESVANPGYPQSNPTLATGDVKIKIDGAAFANVETLPTAYGKYVEVQLSADEMNGDQIILEFSDAAGSEWYDYAMNIITTTSTADDIADVKAKTDNLPSDPAGASVIAGRFDTVDTATASIKAKTDNLPSDPADASVIDALITALPDAILDETNAIETGWTVRKALRIILSATVGKVSGAEGTEIVFRNVTDSKDRITATVDKHGNRSSVTLDGG